MTTSKISSYQFSELLIARELSARYSLSGQIGKGRYSVVYLATDHFEQRQVAIKVAQLAEEENADGGLHKLWMNEVRLSGRWHNCHDR